MRVPQTELQVTPFCDAVSRGDLEMTSFLLRDARVDASLGSRVAAHPVLYAAMSGNLDMLALFAEHPAKLLPSDDDKLEGMLYATAAANGQKAALEFVQNYYIDARPLGKLTPGRQLVKIRREFNKIDADGNGFCDEGEVRELFRALGECPRPAARVPRMRQEAQRAAKRGAARPRGLEARPREAATLRAHAHVRACCARVLYMPQCIKV